MVPLMILFGFEEKIFGKKKCNSVAKCWDHFNNNSKRTDNDIIFDSSLVFI